MSPHNRMFVVFLLPYVLSYFFRSSNAVIAGDLMLELGLGPEQLGAMTGVFFLSFALAQLPIGPALDRFGPRRTVASLLAATALGSLVFAFAPSFGVLALGRALIGLGVAGVLVGSLKAFSAWFPPRRFATVSGMFVALGASGALLATTPLVALVALVGWRAVFVVGAGLTLAAGFTLLLLARDAPGSSPPAPRQGSLLEVLRVRRFWPVALLNFALVGSLFSYQSLWLGPYLLEGQGLAPLVTGNLLFALGLGSVGGYFVSGLLADRFGLRRVILGAALAFFAVQLALALLPTGAPLPWLGLALASFGVFGAFNVLLFADVRSLFPPSLTGRALALNNLFGMSGVALLQWFLGFALVRLEPTPGPLAPSAYSGLFWVTGLLGLVSLLLYLPHALEDTDRKAEGGELGL